MYDVSVAVAGRTAARHNTFSAYNSSGVLTNWGPAEASTLATSNGGDAGRGCCVKLPFATLHMARTPTRKQHDRQLRRSHGGRRAFGS